MGNLELADINTRLAGIEDSISEDRSPKSPSNSPKSPASQTDEYLASLQSQIRLLQKRMERLSKMIRKQSNQSQFLVVSLRRLMIEAADRTILQGRGYCWGKRSATANGVTQARGRLILRYWASISRLRLRNGFN